MPLLSIIIPVYNTEKYLKRCLNSVLNQTLHDIEIICVNDGSTDNSAKILQNIQKKDSRIKIINHDNQGLSCSRNTGIDKATGEWIGFVDSDDYVDNDFYEKLLILATTSNADIAMSGTKIYWQENLKGILFPFETVECLTLKNKIKILRGGGVCDKIYNLNMLRKNNVRFPDGHNYEGNLFLLKAVYYANKVSFRADSFYHYDMRPSSICTTESNEHIIKNIQDRIFIIQEMCAFVKTKRFNRHEKKHTLHYIIRSVLDKQDIWKVYRWEILRNMGIGIFIKLKIKRKLEKIAKRL